MQNPATHGTNPDGECASLGDSCSAVSPLAILGGAAVIAALSAILLMFATGLGFAFNSPWSNDPLTANEFTVATAIWMILIQWIPSAFGGYITGRLRKKWVGADPDEILFRDTAQGLIAWAVAALVGIGILLCASLAGAMASNAAANMIGHQASGQSRSGGPMPYYMDTLFRGNRSGTPVDRDTKDEVGRILMKGALKGPLRNDDRAYLMQLIATRTGTDPAATGTLIDDAVAQIKNAANEARKAAASALIFTFLSMLIGAFTASAMAAFGGQHRDEQLSLKMADARRT